MLTKTALLIATSAVLAGCADVVPDPDPAPGGRIEAQVVSFGADVSATPAFATVSDRPVDLRAFAGWFATGNGRGLWRDDGSLQGIEDERVDAVKGTSYVVAGAVTGCRLSTGAELYRDGADLRVRFTGGTDHPECVRAYAAVVQLAVPADAVEGVRTVQGKAVLDADGPGRLTAFVPLGALRSPPEARAAELPAPGLIASDRVRADLAHRPGRGKRGFAFVLTGCAETGAVLHLSPKQITAGLTGGHGAVCDAAAHFLAVFEIDADRVPATARLKTA